MTFTEDMDRVITEIKCDVRIVEKYIKDMENDNLTMDTLSLEMLIYDLEDKIKTLYVLTNPY